MNTAVPHWSLSSDSQLTAELVFGLMTLAALVYCIWLARRERQIWPIMAFLGGALMAVYEPFNNILANVAYPEEGQHTAFTLFGRDQPVYLVLVYACYFGMTTPWLMKRFEEGVTSREFMTLFAAVVAFAAVFEPLPVAADWWTYYGDNQPLEVFGVPMWWWFANAAVVTGTAVLFTLLRRHVLTADWQTVVLVPASVPCLFVWHASAAFPTYAAISGDASETVTTLASLLTITLAICWGLLMARIIGTDARRTPTAERDADARALPESAVPTPVA